MTLYARAGLTADRLLARFGYNVTIRSVDTAGDPVTGLGGSVGATRTVVGMVRSIDNRAFPESLVQSGDRMFIFAGEVLRGEFVVDGGAVYSVAEVVQIKPDNATHVITKALVRG